MKIRFIKFNENVITPARKHYNDTGADVFMLEDGYIMPHSTVKIPLGFGIDLPDGFNARMQVRTSIAQKGIHVHSCAIDAGYKGQIHLIVTNLSDSIFEYSKNDRLAYIEVYPCIYAQYVEDLGEERGTGSFGSTGT